VIGFPSASIAASPDLPVHCSTAAGGPAIALSVAGVKAPRGKLRVYVYGDDPTMFLKRKKRLKRVNVDADQRDPVRICIRVPKPGRYALIVQHDINGNKRADWSDGGGASRNPNVTLLRLRPKYEETSFEVRGVERLDIRLKYRQGFKIAPLS
jgi:uncharacterized protein (DUF2141 family)